MRYGLLCIALLAPAVASGRSSGSVSFRGGGPGGRPRGGGLGVQSITHYRGGVPSGPPAAIRHGGPRRGGPRHGGGVTIHYRRRTSHSDLDIRFTGGTWTRSYGGYTGFVGGGYGGSGGVYIHSGWVPYSPYLYGRFRPWTSTQGIGPFSYVHGVRFVGGGGAAVFGEAASDAEAAEARAGGAPTGEVSARDLVDRGDELFARNRFKSAVALYRQAAEAAPDDPMAAFALGHGLFAIGDYRGAAKALRRGLRLFPDMVRVRINRRDFYGDKGAFDAHLQRLSLHVCTMPRDEAARFVLAYHCFFADQRHLARGLFEQLGPEDREAQLFVREINRAARRQ